MYLGQRIQVEENPDYDPELDEMITTVNISYPGSCAAYTTQYDHMYFSKEKLILRPISALTKEEYLQADRIVKLIDTPGFNTATRGLVWISDFVKGLPVPNGNILQQYLDSIGIDTPKFLLDGQTLQQVGWAVYEKGGE